LSKTAIGRYKAYMNHISVPLQDFKSPAVAANREVFGDVHNLAAITRYVEQGIFPWEKRESSPVA
jgi:polyketide biosynthesis enoyl-CoA hydratase PksH